MRPMVALSAAEMRLAGLVLTLAAAMSFGKSRTIPAVLNALESNTNFRFTVNPSNVPSLPRVFVLSAALVLLIILYAARVAHGVRRNVNLVRQASASSERIQRRLYETQNMLNHVLTLESHILELQGYKTKSNKNIHGQHAALQLLAQENDELRGRLYKAFAPFEREAEAKLAAQERASVGVQHTSANVQNIKNIKKTNSSVQTTLTGTQLKKAGALVMKASEMIAEQETIARGVQVAYSLVVDVEKMVNRRIAGLETIIASLSRQRDIVWKSRQNAVNNARTLRAEERALRGIQIKKEKEIGVLREQNESLKDKIQNLEARLTHAAFQSR